ncbi:MAG: hypothetical protein PHX15_00905 [Candidatus Nanoarchaeia archaeon]|jgi:hypothetical protein|nr:hypothetical protein [Candidatus Nanoarchaeia archaeon]MDD3993739.1 hypothetical protein [Candidatus Nanoarchaeia archaeon]MDD4563475.1 hypothetical protein [Candidatus Nanoarchaeia archaeon]
MKDLKKDILGGLVTIVLATTIGCTSLPLTSQEPINSNKNTYTIQKVKGIKVPFTENTRILRGLDLKSYNKPFFYFNSNNFNNNSSYLLEKYNSLLADEDTSKILYILYPIGESQEGEKVYESYKVNKDKFDKELENDSDFYETLKKQRVYVSRNFIPELVDEKDESVNSIDIYYNPTPKVEDKNSIDPEKPNYDIPTYIPGNSDTIGGGEYNPGSGGSVGN